MTTGPAKPGARSRQRTFACAGCLAVAAIPLLFDLALVWRARRDLAALRAERERLGDPLVLTPRRDPAEEGPWHQAIARMAQDDDHVLDSHMPDGARLSFSRPKIPVANDLVDAFLMKNGEALHWARLAVSAGIGLRHPHPLEWSGLVDRACLRALRHAERGEPDRALDDLDLAWQIAHAPLLGDGDYPAYSAAPLLPLLERLLATSNPSAARCRESARKLAAPLPTAALVRHVEGQRALAIQALARSRAGDVDGAAAEIAGAISIMPYPRVEREWYAFVTAVCPWVLDRDELLCVGHLSKARDLVVTPRVSAYPELEALARDVADAPEIYWVSHWLAGSPGVLTIPGLSELSSFLDHSAHRTLSRAALELRATKLERGSYPTTSDVIDPWTESPVLVHATKGGGVTLEATSPWRERKITVTLVR